MANPLDQFVSPHRSTTDFKLPSVPDLGVLVKGRGLMPALGLWQSQIEQWRQQVERQITQLAQTDTEEEEAPAVVTQAPQISQAVKKQIQDILDQLAAHIAANIVHGTNSPVVGETDEQSLEAKTIGQIQPRDGKFRHMIQSSRVESGEIFTIPAGYNCIVAGIFVVDGQMIVEGAFSSG